MTDEDVAVPMTREYIHRQVLVWLECESARLGILNNFGKSDDSFRALLADSLTDHLVNNALQLQQCGEATGDISVPRGWLHDLLGERNKGREKIKQMDQALRRADASLSALNGFYVTEDFDEYGDAQRNGLDPNGAWDCFVESMATIDEHATLATIRCALQLQVAGDAKATAPEPEEETT